MTTTQSQLHHHHRTRCRIHARLRHQSSSSLFNVEGDTSTTEQRRPPAARAASSSSSSSSGTGVWEELLKLTSLSPCERVKLRHQAKSEEEGKAALVAAAAGINKTTLTSTLTNKKESVKNIEKQPMNTITTTTRRAKPKWMGSQGKCITSTLPLGTVIAVEMFSENRFEECRVMKHLSVRTVLHFTKDGPDMERLYDLTIRRFFILSGSSQTVDVTIENDSDLLLPLAEQQQKKKMVVDKTTSVLPKPYDRISCRWGDGNVYHGLVRNVLTSNTHGPLVFVRYDDGDECWCILTEEDEFHIITPNGPVPVSIRLQEDKDGSGEMKQEDSSRTTGPMATGSADMVVRERSIKISPTSEDTFRSDNESKYNDEKKTQESHGHDQGCLSVKKRRKYGSIDPKKLSFTEMKYAPDRFTEFSRLSFYEPYPSAIKFDGTGMKLIKKIASKENALNIKDQSDAICECSPLPGTTTKKLLVKGRPPMSAMCGSDVLEKFTNPQEASRAAGIDGCSRSVKPNNNKKKRHTFSRFCVRHPPAKVKYPPGHPRHASKKQE